MTKPYLIQPVGEVSYGHLNKPVRYTPSFLTSVTNQKKIPSRTHHGGKPVNEVTGLYYKDGGLYATFKDEIESKNKGLSPIFNVTKYKEFGDYIEPIIGKIESIDFQDNPRNKETFLYNSATVIDETNDGDDILGNEGNLLEQIGALKTEVNNSKKAEEAVRSKLTAKENEFNELKTKYDDLETKFKSFADKEANSVETLASELANGDEELEAVYKQNNIDQLKILKTKKQAQINEKVVERAKELAQDDEDLLKVLEKLSLGDIETIKKSNEKWDNQFANDTGFRGAGAGHRQGYNRDGNSGNNDKFDFKALSKKHGIKT